MPAAKIDRIDLKILIELQKRGRVTNAELADAVGLSASPSLLRVKRLQKAGISCTDATGRRPRPDAPDRSWRR